MNFLQRYTAHNVSTEQVPTPESPAGPRQQLKPSATLEGLIADDPFPQSPTAEARDGEAHGSGDENGSIGGVNAKNDTFVLENHQDVSEEEGWITIPQGELPDGWNNATDIQSLCSVDRSFVFPGEQVHILACLSACKQDTEIITPFKVAAVMSKNGIGQSPEKQNGRKKEGRTLESGEGEVSSDGQDIDQNGNGLSKQDIDPKKDISASESLLRMEDQKRKTETLLQKFRNSHFFVRIAESGEPLWSKKSPSDPISSEMDGQNYTINGTKTSANETSRLGALIDRGNFDANLSGGAARNSFSCCSLPNGDVVVLLQVNVGINFLRDPVIEILQFEKYHEINPYPKSQDNLIGANYDPCGELLKWLLPLDNTLPPARSLSPPRLSPGTGIGGTPQKPTPSGSQLFSHFRSYSMSSLPQNTTPPQHVKAQSYKPNFDIGDWNQYSSQKLWKGQKMGGEGLLSFRGVSLERQRFSVRCGLEGIYIPGRRWRRKLEIIQPVEIHSFAADCNTEDLLCVQIKNICPPKYPDIMVYIDAITVVFEEAAKSGSPSSLPIACIEAGNDHCLPNLALRRGEEHSFILKPACPLLKNLKVHSEKISPSPNSRLASNSNEGKNDSSIDQYAVMVSCRCNYTDSRLFFKQPTAWRPRVSRDLMISVASEMLKPSSGANERAFQLPVQVLNLQASNLTSEDLTMTVLAPASFTSPPSVGSLVSPSSSMAQLESSGRMSGERNGAAVHRGSSVPPTENPKQSGLGGVQSVSFNGQTSPITDVIPSNGFGCTHLWLQSRIPLGCVPAQSTATIKLELLPLTDGIITLDTLQIAVKEKGQTYVPEHSLKINATSSISTRIV